MQIGDRLIRDLAAKFSEIYEEFELLGWIDKAIAEKTYQVDRIISEIIYKTKPLFKASKAGAFVVSADRIYKLGLPQEIHTAGVDLTKTMVENYLSGDANVSIVEDKQEGVAKLLLPFKPAEQLLIVLLYEAPWYGGETSSFHEHGIKDFATKVAIQCKTLIKYKIEKDIEQTKDDITDAFFRHRLEPEKCWAELTNRFADFLPAWYPLRLEPTPLVQVLTYDGNRTSILLRATRERKHSQAKALILKDTVSGMVVEDEEGMGRTNKDYYAQGCLYVDPTSDKIRSRYASYLYKEMPRCELVVPIRHQGKLIGLVNLEHKEPYIFSPYHIEVLKKGAEFAGPFIAALEHEEDEKKKRDIRLLYVLHNILHKMARTYRHKIGQQITVSQLSLEVLEEPAKNFSGEHKEFFERLRRAVTNFTTFSKSFVEDLPNYVKYERITLMPLVRKAIEEFDPQEMERAEDIKMEIISDIPDDTEIFGSTLIREHLYNTLNNSIEAIRPRLKKGEIEKGIISIHLTMQEQTDKEGKEDSYPLVVIRIEDNGGGVEPDKEPFIYEVGFSTKIEGSGIGLSAAEEYIEAIGGHLRHQNKWPHGFILEMFLPKYTAPIHTVLEKKLNFTQGDAKNGNKSKDSPSRG